MAAGCDGTTRIPLLLIIALLVCLCGAPWEQAAEAQCMRCGANDACACPVPEPVLETDPGTSMYWHDHCGSGYECCFRRFYCNEACRPTWYVNFEFLPLFRNASDWIPEDAVVLPQPPPVTTMDFDADFDPGAHIVLGHKLGDWYRMEVAWKGSYSWSDTVLATPDDGAPTEAIAFSSNLNDVEVNFRRRLCIRRGGALKERFWAIGEASCLIGLRYMNIEESFSYVSGPDPLNAVAVETSNDLFGVQLGHLGQILVHDRAWIDTEIKGSVLFNEAKRSGVSTQGALLAVSEDRAAFLGDLSVTLNYQFAPSWTFRGGYNAMWMTGVALAANNLATNMDHSSDVVYHGPQVGFVWTR
jgi:hypothetical protein